MAVNVINNHYTSFTTNNPDDFPLVSWKERDARVQQLIDESFQLRVLPLHKGMFESKYHNYLFVGSEEYTFDDREMSLVGQSAIEIAEQFSKKERFDALDLGTGNGRFLKSLKDRFNNVDVLGVTAADFRDTRYASNAFRIPDEEYVVGNIENLNQLPSLQDRKFDFITSHVTFRHLSDPVGVICQAYEFLKPNGLMILDEFTLNGISGEEYVNAFKNAGCHEVEIVPECHVEIDGIRRRILAKPLTTSIRKTTDHLDLQLHYDLTRSTRADADHQAQIFYKA
jgi:SAM-dependent methyltransferase